MPSGPQSHFWPDSGEEVEPARIDRDDADRLGAVDENRQASPLAQLVHREQLARRPEHVRQGQEPRARRDRRHDLVRIGRDDDDASLRRVQRAEQAEVLVRRRDHLVAVAEIETGQHDVAPVRRRRGERDLLDVDVDELREV